MVNKNLIERVQDEIEALGGKGFHLNLLSKGGFLIPKTYLEEELDNIPNGTYAVRSSAALEDSATETGAGKFSTLHGVKRNGLLKAIAKVKKGYKEGNVVIQPDLTDKMDFSGVMYTNLNGELFISMGTGSSVQSIVEGGSPHTEISLSQGEFTLRGSPVDPKVVSLVRNTGLKVEQYFGIPMDIEFAVMDGNVTLLQSRPLPNPTDKAIREHELRVVKRKMEPLKNAGLDEIVLGVGNYREIIGGDAATRLSASIFNYAFSGDGVKLGGQQLGRNELGYDLGTEIHPWVMMTGGRVFFNFAGDALQFRPSGIEKTELLDVVNGVYLPQLRGNPTKVDYPELHLYIQFPKQANQVGLRQEPYAKLAASNLDLIKTVVAPTSPSTKILAQKHESVESCADGIHRAVDIIRTKSAREYSKAARLGFFALENLRVHLDQLRLTDPQAFTSLAEAYGRDDPAELRDAMAYDESIISFEVPQTEDFRYLGSFEISEERGFPPARKFKQGRKITHKETAEIVAETRNILSYREKVKFSLFRDYDHVRQLIDQLSDLTGLGEDIYHLDFSELPLLAEEPVLALYRIDFQREIKRRDVFGEGPIFENQLARGKKVDYNNGPKLIFGNLGKENTYVKIGESGHIVASVDQTVAIPDGTEVVFVPSNVRPGSHLFTVLSDYAMPVIAVPNGDFKNMLSGSKVGINSEQGGITLEYNMG